MKLFAGAGSTDENSLPVRNDTTPVLPKRQIVTESQNTYHLRRNKRVKKGTAYEPPGAKQSATTKSEVRTRKGSLCPSNFSFGKKGHRFQKPKKVISLPSEPTELSSQYNILTFHNRDRNKNYRFNCFPDQMLKMPENLRHTLRTINVDFDVDSSEHQIQGSISKITNQLKQAAEFHNRSSVRNDQGEFT